jgi:hypothetical protein
MNLLSDLGTGLSGFCLQMGSSFVKTPWRRRWDLNPRKVSPHTISNRADSAALALLQVSIFKS